MHVKRLTSCCCCVQKVHKRIKFRQDVHQECTSKIAEYIMISIRCIILKTNKSFLEYHEQL